MADYFVKRGSVDVGVEAVRRAVHTARTLVDNAERAISTFYELEVWNEAVDAASAYSRRTGEILSADLIRFAVAICAGADYRYSPPGGPPAPAPPGAPPPLDWVIWAQRILDRPVLWSTAADPRGRTRRLTADPYAVALSSERPEQLPPARRWAPETGAWLVR